MVSVSVSSVKSFVMSQKVMQLAVGLFILVNTMKLVRTINDALLTPVATYAAKQVTDKVNLGNITLGVGADIEALSDGVIAFVISMAVLHIIMKMSKISAARIPLTGALDI